MGDDGDVVRKRGRKKREHGRAFPELPEPHQLHTLPMTIEHGDAWLNCAFASDCCVSVDGRHFFLHAAYVERDSDYFRGWLQSGMSAKNRFAQPLDGLPFPETFGSIIEWIYTRRCEFSKHGCLWEVYHAAKYLGIKEELFDVLLGHIVERWCNFKQKPSVLLSDALTSSVVPACFLQRVLAQCESNGAAFDNDTRLLVLMHWAKFYDSVDEADRKVLGDLVNFALPLCTTAGIQEAMNIAPATFDITVQPSRVIPIYEKANLEARSMFPATCLRCKKTLHSLAELNKQCTLVKKIHSQATYRSKSGNTICNDCNKPVSFDECCYKAGSHTAITRDGVYQISKVFG